MDIDVQTIKLTGFEDYLIKKGHSAKVVLIYTRKVGKFLSSKGASSAPCIHHEELKKAISEYTESIPLSFQKATIQAALHAYYLYISGKQFIKRMYTKEYDMDIAIEVEIDRFRKYLFEVAGLSNSTVIDQCNTVKAFLYSSFPEKNSSSEEITADHIRIYFTHSLRHLSAGSKKTIISRIRSYIRFLQFADGFHSDEILKLPMTSPVWNQAALPKYITEADTGRLLATYDRTKPTGIRNYAIARCLKDLGLRSSEVAGLSLDDFNWILGTVTIKKTKSHSERTLPLHAITGQAIEMYMLHSRPATLEKILFVRMKNEKGHAMGPSQVRETVRSAAISAGLDNFTGTHMLRHAAANRMINSGIDLKTIADVLGHKSIETTCIYTKLNITQLKDVAATWPGARS
ncbi:MAG TPA: hypothetical protein DD730_17245 [Desulfosporosinus sp.]|jgi:site-specific recombinase XerD|nr:hypothetical protein [Desulfosporosinus sp.]